MKASTLANMTACMLANIKAFAHAAEAINQHHCLRSSITAVSGSVSPINACVALQVRTTIPSRLFSFGSMPGSCETNPLLDIRTSRDCVLPLTVAAGVALILAVALSCLCKKLIVYKNGGDLVCLTALHVRTSAGCNASSGDLCVLFSPRWRSSLTCAWPKAK